MTPPNVLYLDIDGVLNGHQHCNGLPGPYILPEPAAVMSTILQRINFEIVLISAWAHRCIELNMTPRQFSWLLQTHGVNGANIVRYLPNEPENRATTILDDVRKLPEKTKHVVIDDLDLAIGRHIRPESHLGLIPHHVHVVSSMF